MEELFEFIRNMNINDKENIRDTYLNFIDLIKNINIEGSEKLVDEYGCSFKFDNICIILSHNEATVYIEILINKKYLYAFDGEIIYGVVDYENLNDIITNGKDYDDSSFLEFKFNDSNISYCDGSIEWLLDHKSTKSARK